MQPQASISPYTDHTVLVAWRQGIAEAIYHQHAQRSLLALALLSLLTLTLPANANHTVACRADLPVHPGESMIWRAFVTGGSGSFTFSWTGQDGLTGNTQTVTKAYAATGFKVARVTVTDTANGHAVPSDCGMHVTPTSFSEPPSVTPILWVPSGVNPALLEAQLQRVWRSIHAGFYHLYGKTFLMRPMRTIVSARTENDICGGDCTNRRMADTLVRQAWSESEAAIGGLIPYTRAILVMAGVAAGLRERSAGIL
jgi:hypothetical protein